MGLLDDIRSDAERIITDLNGFGQLLTFTTKDGTVTKEVPGRHTKHHMGLGTDGLPTNVKNASVTVMEKTLVDLSYPVRNAEGEVELVGHRVSCTDSRTNVVCNYIIRQVYPSESIGNIVCILGDYE